MATKKQTATGDAGGSPIVKITDPDGRVHYTARGSATHKRLAAGGATAEAVPETPEAADASPDAS